MNYSLYYLYRHFRLLHTRRRALWLAWGYWTKRGYIGETFLPQLSPNGAWWMLYGRVQVLRMGRRISFGVRFRKYARGWFFGFGPRNA